jgi:zinc transporter ZupT
MTGWLVPLGFGLVASLATLAGGLLALRLAHRTSLILAVAAGIVLGVAFLDLLPEALAFGEGRYGAHALLAGTAAGFAGYLLLSRLLARAEHRDRWQAHLGPASLTLHSLLDGVLMGVAFQIAPGIGLSVAIAVLMHDVADGLNTVSLALAASQRRAAIMWLLVNGAAPITGVAIGLLIRLDAAMLAPLLAVFAGIFLYIGACELVPRSLLRDGRLRTTGAVLGGMALILAATGWAH